MPQPSALRLIRYAAAFALQRPEMNEPDWLCCDGKPVAVKCASVSRWACRKEDAKTRRACGWMCIRWQGEKKCSDCQRTVAYSY
jgi:nuclear transport factor 2 (NTF2) superfamily protein